MRRDLPDDHDLPHLDAALEYVSDFGAALDCGAHRGIWTRPLCDRFDQVIAVEPTGLAGHIDPRARVIRAAVGAETGMTGLEAFGNNTGQTRCVPGDAAPVITIDSLALPDLDFLKLDVEGWELFALQGGATTVRCHRPVVVLEENGLCGHYGVTPGSAGRLLESWGARLVQVCGRDHVYTW